ncbi:hypothetical protein FVE85_3622 [Porphyridium purpureum]|uniref:Pentatricopeptide repeat-containing protein n=1 Tax=Porphyridium purpureum TaxID=35688 RepID=A0A5J4YNA3_PORPP|nr:hypothetical protein FVE85_3622 [Porphyridium purpureum]|eukprot:POR7989..scf249_10
MREKAQEVGMVVYARFVGTSVAARVARRNFRAARPGSQVNAQHAQHVEDVASSAMSLRGQPLLTRLLWRLQEEERRRKDAGEEHDSFAEGQYVGWHVDIGHTRPTLSNTRSAPGMARPAVVEANQNTDAARPAGVDQQLTSSQAAARTVVRPKSRLFAMRQRSQSDAPRESQEDVHAHGNEAAPWSDSMPVRRAVGRAFAVRERVATARTDLREDAQQLTKTMATPDPAAMQPAQSALAQRRTCMESMEPVEGLRASSEETKVPVTSMRQSEHALSVRKRVVPGLSKLEQNGRPNAEKTGQKAMNTSVRLSGDAFPVRKGKLQRDDVVHYCKQSIQAFFLRGSRLASLPAPELQHMKQAEFSTLQNLLENARMDDMAFAVRRLWATGSKPHTRAAVKGPTSFDRDLSLVNVSDAKRLAKFLLFTYDPHAGGKVDLDRTLANAPDAMYLRSHVQTVLQGGGIDWVTEFGRVEQSQAIAQIAAIVHDWQGTTRFTWENVVFLLNKALIIRARMNSIEDALQMMDVFLRAKDAAVWSNVDDKSFAAEGKKKSRPLARHLPTTLLWAAAHRLDPSRTLLLTLFLLQRYQLGTAGECMFIELLRAIAQRGDWVMWHHVFSTMLNEYGVSKITLASESMVQLSIRTGEVEFARKLVMDRMHVSESDSCDALGRLDSDLTDKEKVAGTKAGDSPVHLSWEVTPVHITRLLSYLVQQRETLTLAQAIVLHKRSVAWGVRPSLRSYTCLLVGLAKHRTHLFDAVPRTVMEDFWTSGLELDLYMAQALIFWYARDRDLDACFHVLSRLDEVERKRRKLTGSSRQHARKLHGDSMRHVVLLNQQLCFSRSLKIYRSCIVACTNTGDTGVREAFQIYERMKNELTYEPDSIFSVYSALANVLLACKSNVTADQLEYVSEKMEQGILRNRFLASDSVVLLIRRLRRRFHQLSRDASKRQDTGSAHRFEHHASTPDPAAGDAAPYPRGDWDDDIALFNARASHRRELALATEL